MNDVFKQTIVRGCTMAGIEIPGDVIKKYEKYYQLLCQKNSEFNLTSITDPAEAAEKHFIDSILLYQDISRDKSISTTISMVDIGSGAGFPGLPLKIYQPDIIITLIDAVGKKVNFMQQVIKELDIDNARAIHIRAEELSVTGREKYDVAVSRAVAELRVLVEYALPLVKVGGLFIAAKGPNVQDELSSAERAIKILGGKIIGTRHIALPLSHEGRSIITIEKVNNTPDKYPRRAGIPKKRPL
ncbi:16S rRNA (guanine(527)-N(7))-methyltransferase RsmG [Desulfallas thermosapovorans]|uniref:Ribosomal RNA small subunit methyltransferase G n=1 Tax=Desulfallas thermosapovorans DSM 6562 TaxID=1121431 RepID=A0A5S4ZUF6_9FIRM|nr:16S rRNA (guanine(527)-N(7))-methyltransferase RsmG [Desulfallas thermosapovorans]TYO96424.1 16S rRNA (guanine527-N7)-methyltransferase [Desulfallas thermosapovorans DSM 6562]